MVHSAEQIRAFSIELLRALYLTPAGGREEWLRPMLEATRRATGAAFAYVGETSASGWMRTAVVGDGLAEKKERHFRGLARRLLSTGDSLLLPVVRSGSLFQRRYDGWDDLAVGSYAASRIPLGAPDRAWIVLLQDLQGAPFGSHTVELLGLAGEAIATARANEVKARVMEDLALTDDLTHIANYRCLRKAVGKEIARARRCDDYFTVVMVDMDNLKQYNQTHGHLAGSEILRDLARLLCENVRKTDLAGKYGGDEFVLILPHTRPEGGKVLCERIRCKLGEELRGCAGESLSCSFGVAGFPEDGGDFEALVRAADQALFRAKKEGRNAVVCVTRPEEGAEQEAA